MSCQGNGPRGQETGARVSGLVFPLGQQTWAGVGGDRKSAESDFGGATMASPTAAGAGAQGGGDPPAGRSPEATAARGGSISHGGQGNHGVFTKKFA